MSDTLNQELHDFYAWFSELFFRAESGERASLMDRRLLDSRGIALWTRLRTELGDTHRVLYYSHEFGQDFESPEDFRATRRKTYA